MQNISKKILLIFIFIINLAFNLPVLADDIDCNNEYKRISRLLEASYSPKYIKKFNNVIEKARKYAEKKFIKNGVIVLDIDETVLDNRGYFNHFKCNRKKYREEWIELSEAVPFDSSVKLIEWAKEFGYKIVLITGRSESQRKATIDNLNKYSIPYDLMYLKPNDYRYKSLAIFKKSIRKKLNEEGYKVIVNIGDQKSDLKGGFGKGYKLPNIIYTVK